MINRQPGGGSGEGRRAEPESTEVGWPGAGAAGTGLLPREPDLTPVPVLGSQEAPGPFWAERAGAENTAPGAVPASVRTVRRPAMPRRRVA